MADVSRQVPASLIADRYRVQEQIGAGGMGIVWKAWDERLDRPVAIKQLHPARGMDHAEAERAIARAMREARITARLHHQHAVQIFDVVEQDGQPCLIMPYLPSKSLLALLREQGPLSPEEVARIGGQVASALAAAHAAGIVHRDVTPGNILVTEDGSAKISDFGISRALGDSTITSTGMVIGTPAYLAPEVARGGPTTQSSDVFSLGATLYTAVEGRPPFGTHENSMALLHEVASGQVTPPRRAGRLTSLLDRLLARSPAARPSMAEAAEELAALADPPPSAARSVPADSVPADRAAPAGPVPAGPAPAGAVTAGSRPPSAAGTAATRVFPTASPAEGVRTEPSDEPPLDRPTRRSPRRELVFALIGVAAGLAILLALLVPTLGDGPGNAARKPFPSSAPTQTAPSAVPPTSSSTSSPTPTTTSSPTRKASSPPRSTSSSSVRGTPTAAQLTAAIAGYYRLVPGDTDAGWSRLTRAYQTSTAVSRDYYETFWGSVQAVSARNISASPPGTVVATLTYSMKDGRTIRERTSFGLVMDGGILKINSSHVLSSQQV